LIVTSYLLLVLPRGIAAWGVCASILYAFYTYPVEGFYPAHFILFHFVVLIICDAEHEPRSY